MWLSGVSCCLGLPFCLLRQTIKSSAWLVLVLALGLIYIDCISCYREQTNINTRERDREKRHFEAEKIRTINQSHWTNTGHSRHSNVKGPEKERKDWGTEKQTSNENNSWWQKYCKSCEEPPKNIDLSDIINNLNGAVKIPEHMRLISPKVMERAKCGQRNDLCMIQSKQARTGSLIFVEDLTDYGT